MKKVRLEPFGMNTIEDVNYNACGGKKFKKFKK
jgi:hypothetical protein